MKKTFFNDNWTVERGVKDPFAEMMGAGQAKPVTLPHDAMIEEERTPTCPSGCQTGFYPSHSYTYKKRFTAPEAWKDRQTILEFEGVMQKAVVLLNGDPIARHAYGYSQFFVDLRPHLRYGRENELTVLAISVEKSSRWYPGGGIYRDVTLHTAGGVAVEPEGLRVTTRDIEDGYAVVEVDTALRSIFPGSREALVTWTILDPDGRSVCTDARPVTLPHMGAAQSHTRLTVPAPALWSPHSPALYTIRAEVTVDGVGTDTAEETFGIRTVKVDARRGLRVNGETVKLRGACIHHDNGVIGACTLEAAEAYRIGKLKAAGFNAIRSAHHPAGKALLRVCDRLGMLVMDELCDMWGTPKNGGDFAFDFAGCWQDEVRRMVSKDYDHPSVILYSIGNELPEAGLPSGRIQGREIAALLRREDPTRFVTAGINGMLALRGMSDAERSGMLGAFGGAAPQAPAGTSEGSEGLNDVMGDLSFEARDYLNTMPASTHVLEELCGELDVVGLNYMPARHILERTLHPDRVVVGSESYPTEIARLWRIVEEAPHVIGDFTWTGYDYIGEAGIGSYHYDKMPEGQGAWPDRLAYCGDIDLNGYRRPVSYLREMAFGLRREPFIAVERVDRYGMGCLRNHWKYGDCLDSWTFPGYEGKPARVRVLSPSEEVELFQNGHSLGRKPAGKEHGFTAEYTLTYEPGELVAVGYDGGRETGRFRLQTAGSPSRMQLFPNTDALTADGRDALILDLCLTDEKGVPNLWEEREITIQVTGPAYLAGFGSAAPSGEGGYQEPTTRTFDGRAIAVLRSTFTPGTVTVKLTAEGIQDAIFTIEATAKEVKANEGNF